MPVDCPLTNAELQEVAETYGTPYQVFKYSCGETKSMIIEIIFNSFMTI